MHSLETEILIVLTFGISVLGVLACVDSVRKIEDRLVNRIFTGVAGIVTVTLFPLLVSFLFKTGYIEYSLMLSWLAD